MANPETIIVQVTESIESITPQVVEAVEQVTVQVVEAPPGAPGAPGTTTWNGLTGKPMTFPPDAHAHEMAEVAGLPDALAGKSDTGHTHTLASLGAAGSVQVFDFHTTSAPEGAVPGTPSSQAAGASAVAWEWSLPAGCKFFWAEIISAGGGGGSGGVAASGSQIYGGGGGAGGYTLRVCMPAAAVITPLTVTVGVGGAGGASVASGNGNAGLPGGKGSINVTGLNSAQVGWFQLQCGYQSGGGGGGAGGTPSNGTGGNATGLNSTFTLGISSQAGLSSSVIGTTGTGGNTNGTVPGRAGAGISSANVAYSSGVSGGSAYHESMSWCEGIDPTSRIGRGGSGGNAYIAANGQGGNATPPSYGGGGGGGAAARSGYTSGAGGNGGNGIVRIICFF